MSAKAKGKAKAKAKGAAEDDWFSGALASGAIYGATAPEAVPMSAKAAAKAKAKAKLGTGGYPKAKLGAAPKGLAKGKAKGKAKPKAKPKVAEGPKKPMERLGGKKKEKDIDSDEEPEDVMNALGFGFLAEGLAGFLLEDEDAKKQKEKKADDDDGYFGLGTFFSGKSEFEVEAAADVESLGMTPSLPPGQVIINSVAEGGWAAKNGIVAGGEIDRIGGKVAASMQKAEFIKAMKVRPLKLVIVQEGGQQLDYFTADMFSGFTLPSADFEWDDWEFGGGGEREGPPLNLSAGANVKQLGFTPRLPPGKVWIIDVQDGGWAAKAGFKEGSEIETLNGKVSQRMSKQEFIKEMKERPLDIVLLQPVKIKREGPPFECAAGQDVTALGMTPRLPPGRVVIEQLAEGGWAEENGIVVGCEIESVNGKVVKKMNKDDFITVMKERPTIFKILQPEQGIVGGLFASVFGGDEEGGGGGEQPAVTVEVSTDLEDRLKGLAAPTAAVAKPKPRPPLPEPQAPPPPVSRLRPWAPQLRAASSQREASRFEEPEEIEGRPKPKGTTDPRTPIPKVWSLTADRRRALPKALTRKDVAPLRTADATLCVVNEPDAMSEPDSQNSDDSISGAVVRSWDPGTRDNRYLYSRDAAVPFSDPWKSLDWKQEDWVKHLKDTGSIKPPADHGHSSKDHGHAHKEEDEEEDYDYDADFPYAASASAPRQTDSRRQSNMSTRLPTDQDKLQKMAYHQVVASQVTPRGMSISRVVPVAGLDPRMGGYKPAKRMQGATLQEAVDAYRDVPKGVYDDLRLALDRAPQFERLRPAGIEWQMPNDECDIPGRAWL